MKNDKWLIICISLILTFLIGANIASFTTIFLFALKECGDRSTSFDSSNMGLVMGLASPFLTTITLYVMKIFRDLIRGKNDENITTGQ